MKRNVEKQALEGRAIISKNKARDLQGKEIDQIEAILDERGVYDALAAAYYMGVNVGYSIAKSEKV